MRSNLHFTLKENTLKRSDLDDFVNRYLGCSRVSAKREAHGSQSRGYSGSRFERKESERFKSFSYEELTKRDKPSLPYEVPGFPRHAQSLGASCRKAAALPALTSTFSCSKTKASETAP